MNKLLTTVLFVSYLAGLCFTGTVAATGSAIHPVNQPDAMAPIGCTDSGLAIESLQISVPQGGHLIRGPIHYISGSEYEVVIVRSQCSRLEGVYVNGVLQGELDPIEPTGAIIYEEIERVGVRINGQTWIKSTYRFLKTNRGRGQGRNIEVFFESINTGEKVSAEWIVSDVHHVATGSEPVDIVTSVVDIENNFLVAAYKSYGDFNRVLNENNEVQSYDLDFSPLQIIETNSGTHSVGTGLNMRPDGSFVIGLQAKAKVPLLCDPTVSVYGVFNVVDGGADNILIEWVEEPDVRTNLGVACELISTLTVLPKIASEIVDYLYVEGPFAAALTGGLESAIGGYSLPRNTSLDSVESGNGVLTVKVRLPLHSVTIKVPYDTYASNFPTSNYGLPVLREFSVGLIPTGLAEACGGAEREGSNCKAYPITGVGLFNGWSNAPVETASFVTEGGAVGFYQIRQDIRRRLVSLWRELDELPFPDMNIGALVARRGNDSSAGHLMFAGQTCSSDPRTVGGDVDYLGVSVNDFDHSSLKPLGRGEIEAVVMLPETSGVSDLLRSEVAACPRSIISVINEPRAQANDDQTFIEN